MADALAGILEIAEQSRYWLNLKTLAAQTDGIKFTPLRESVLAETGRTEIEPANTHLRASVSADLIN